MDKQYAGVAGQEKRRAPQLETSSERKELAQLVMRRRGNQVEPGKRREEERGSSVKCKEFVSHLRTEAKIRSFAGFLIRPVCDDKELDLGNIFNEILNH